MRSEQTAGSSAIGPDGLAVTAVRLRDKRRQRLIVLLLLGALLLLALLNLALGAVAIPLREMAAVLLGQGDTD
ncbi:hypothetical protein PA598K_00129, partial [Paenibacillus sp. 598K]